MPPSEGPEPTHHAIPASPLDGIRVVEWGEGISAPYCAKLLAELGADVIKIEPPGGDRFAPTRPVPRRGPSSGAQRTVHVREPGETWLDVGYHQAVRELKSSIVFLKRQTSS